MDSFNHSYINPEQFPLVVTPKKGMKKEDFLALLRQHNPFFKERLLQEGAILLRGFPVDTPDDFADVLEAMGTGKGVDYIGGDSPRIRVKGPIYTSTEAPPWMKIPLHNELSFVKNYPTHIYFYCAIAPVDRGQTIIGDCRKIYQTIDPEVRERFVSKGLKYVSRYYYKNALLEKLKGHKTWINVFETEDKAEVEAKCKANEFGYKWYPRDWLEITQTRPAMLEHPLTHEKLWFNQVHLYDFNPRLLGWKYYLGTKLLYCRKHTKLHDVYYGDETPIAREDLYHIHDVLDENTVAFPWQRGDVLVLDNLLAMHGRASFSGKRRVLTAMTR